MGNLLIPRTTIHAWSEEIGQQLDLHQTSLQRLLKDQRRLTRFIEENAENLGPGTGGVCVYMTGVIARMFELAGGSLRAATWEQVREAEKKVGAAVAQLLPLDEGVVDRFHAVEGRAQAHLLDEAAMVLLQTPSPEGQPEMDKKESFKVLLICWVVTEVLDQNWKPGKGFAGEASYTYHHIEPTPLPAAPTA
jgi:hypothetical protein